MPSQPQNNEGHPGASGDPVQALEELFVQLNGLILGKNRQIELAMVCLLAGGHLLIDDVPGVGKTTLSHGLAISLGLQYGRVQFTADLMPSDLTGGSVLDPQAQRFVFHPGPVFNQLLLADEINRAGPKTQGALLEAMEERQVSVDNVTHPLPQPFFVIATQNPLDQRGTYALPESQLDRFLMSISLGYPSREAERAMLTGVSRRSLLSGLRTVLPPPLLAQIQQRVATVHASAPVLDYLQNLIAATRSGQWFVHGLSPRAALALLGAARAHAWLAGRSHVAPDDIQAILLPCAAHRLTALPSSGRSARDQLQLMMDRIEVV
ncbi:AAA family ATPase [Amphibiibacter pelophylacis]|uniref:AAA family ATPase n=1 Tax=Amphibiibacter pelophylacis TaxID=1799477 RepID=A0ACC6P4A9_9BURK